MIYKLPLRISGNFFMDEPQQDFDVLEAIMAQYFPGPISLSGSGLAEHEQEIQNFLQEKMNHMNCLNRKNMRLRNRDIPIIHGFTG